jgi:DHA1 family tetracycline resistance protein-like MFS transporter
VYGILASLYSLMQFTFAPVLGSLSDRFGRRPVILLSLLGSGLDYLLMAWAPTLPWFFLARIVSGITGANFSAATAYIADISPPEKRAANFGLIGAAFGAGFVFGPALGGVLGDVGLRVPFMVAGALTLLNWLYGLVVLPESLPVERRRAFSWRRANPVGALLALREHPVVFRMTGSFFLIDLAHQVLPSTWVLYTTYRYGWSATQVGLSLAIVGITAAIVQGGLTRVFVARMGERRTAMFGLIVTMLAYVGYGLATQGWMIYCILVVGALGMMTRPALQGLISRNVGADEQGSVQGTLSSIASVAGILGPPVATGLFGWFIGPKTPVTVPGAAFFFSSLLVMLAAVLAWRSFRTHREPPGGNARTDTAVTAEMKE